MEFHSDGTNEEMLMKIFFFFMKRLLTEAWVGLREPTQVVEIPKSSKSRERLYL